MKRILAFLLALVLTVGCLPLEATHVHAEEAEETMPVVEEATPAEDVLPEETAEETEPAAQETEPAVEETEPVVEETEPAAEETEPAVEETEPVVEETEPAAEETEPVIEETEPVVAETASTIVSTDDKITVPTKHNRSNVEKKSASGELVKEKKEIRVRKELADGTFTWETKTVTVEKWISAPLTEIIVSNFAKNAIVQDQDYDYQYYFETFEDLKELVATYGGTGDYICAYYRGTEPLVISEDLTLPNEVQVFATDMNTTPEASQQIVIAEGVTLCLRAEMYVGDLVVNGTLEVRNWVNIFSSLTVNGQVNCYNYIWLYNDPTVTGSENINFIEDACFRIELEVNSVAELAEAVTAMDASDPHMYYELYWRCSKDTVLDQSVAIPSNVYVQLCSTGDELGTLTISKGAALSVGADGYLEIYIPVVVKGTLECDSTVAVNGNDAKLTLAEGATLSGKGDIWIGNRDDNSALADIIPGVNLNNYIVNEYGYNWRLTNIIGKERLAAPINLTWNKGLDYVNGQSVLCDYPGSLVWQVVSPVEAVYDTMLYQEVDGEWVWIDGSGYYYHPDNETTWMSADDLAYAQLESGKYKIVVTAYPWDETQYIASEDVESTVFTYKKPSAQLPAATELQIVEMYEDDLETFGLCWSSESEKYVIEWYCSSQPTDNVLEEYENATTFWGWNSDKESSVPGYLLEEWGDGYYYSRVRVVSDDITKTANSPWSAVCGPYHYFDAVQSATQALLKALETSNSPETARQAAQALDQEALISAIRKDTDGTVLMRLRQLEEVAGGAAQIKVADDFTGFTADQVTVVGANLNTPTSADAPITLSIGKAEKTHILADDLNSPDAVQFSMKLDNVTAQTVPVVVTLPIPAGINPVEMVIIHHGASGDEVIKPITTSENSVTILLTHFSDFTITEDVFTQAEFMAEYNAALASGNTYYTLTKPVVLEKDVTFAADEDQYFRLELAKNGSITIPKGVTCTVECYLYMEGTGCEITVEGTLNLVDDHWFSEIDVAEGTFTVAEGGKVNAPFIVRFDNPNAKLNGWTDEKTYIVSYIDTVDQLRAALAGCEKYYFVNARVLSEEYPLTMDADLVIPKNAAVGINYTDFIVASGAKLINNGQLSFEESEVTVEAGAEIVNEDWMGLWYSVLNLQGTYSGKGYLDIDEDSTINGNFLQIECYNQEFHPMMGLPLSVKTYQDDPNAEFVWSVVSGGEYVTLTADGNEALLVGKITDADHVITVKVTTADGTLSNTFDITLTGGHTYSPFVVKPTYTQYGYTAYVCDDEDCGAYYIDYNSLVKPTGLPKPSVKVSNNTKGKPVLSWKHDGEADYYYVYRATSKTGKKTYIGKTTGSSYTDSKASLGKTYYYFVKAICEEDSSLNSAYSTYDKAVGKTAAPTVTVSVSSSTGKPTVKWKKVTGAKKYTVYRATSKNGSYKAVKTTTSTSYTDKSAKPGTTYYYKVKTIASKGSTYDSVYSSVKSAKCIPAKPAAKIALSSKKPKVSWKKVSGATKYEVYRSTKKSSGYTKIKTTSSTSFRDSTAKKGKTYYYKVVAVKGSAKSAYSNVVKIKSK